MSDTTAVQTTPGALPPFAQPAEDVIAGLQSSADVGLTSAEATSRLAKFGPNSIKGEKPPSVVSIALGQLRDPMNLMLVAVAIVSLIIGEVSTAVVVALLVVLNLTLGTRQELTARASVDALSKLQVPQVASCATASSCSSPPRTSSRATSSRSRPGTSSRPTAA